MEISLVIAVYNGEKYLKTCLDSVKAQTFTDFEVICVNDGSTDNSLQILEEYSQNDSRVKIINKKNEGCSVARNVGIRWSQGNFLTFLDQDDLLHPQAFEMLHYMIEKYRADVASFTYQDVPDNFVLSQPQTYNVSDLKEHLINYPFKYFFKNKKGSSVVVWTRLYRKSSVGDLCFPQGIQPAEDTIYTLMVLNRIKKLVTTKLPLLYYRNSSISVMNMGITGKYVKSHLDAGCKLYDYFITNHRLSANDEKIMKYYITRILYKTTISQPMRFIRNTDDFNKISGSYHNRICQLYQKKVFEPHRLKLTSYIASWLYLHKFYRLSRLFM